jgi:hypothetical protein
MRLKWKLVSVHLEIVLFLTQDRCTVCAEGTTGSKITLDTPDRTPRWPGSCGFSFCSFRDSVSISVRQVHGLHQTYRRLINHFEWAWGYSYVMRHRWMLVSVRLEIVLILRQDRCMVLRWAYHRHKIILDTPDRTQRWRGSYGISFRSI